MSSATKGWHLCLLRNLHFRTPPITLSPLSPPIKENWECPCPYNVVDILFKSLSILAYVIISNNKGLSESTPYNISRFGSESRQTQFWCHSHSSGERVTFSSPQGTSGCALSCPKQLDTCKYCLKDQQLFSSFGSFTMQQEKGDLLGPLWSTFITGLLFFFLLWRPGMEIFKFILITVRAIILVSEKLSIISLEPGSC